MSVDQTESRSRRRVRLASWGVIVSTLAVMASAAEALFHENSGRMEPALIIQLILGVVTVSFAVAAIRAFRGTG